MYVHIGTHSTLPKGWHMLESSETSTSIVLKPPENSVILHKISNLSVTKRDADRRKDKGPFMKPKCIPETEWHVHQEISGSAKLQALGTQQALAESLKV